MCGQKLIYDETVKIPIAKERNCDIKQNIEQSILELTQSPKASCMAYQAYSEIIWAPIDWGPFAYS